MVKNKEKNIVNPQDQPNYIQKVTIRKSGTVSGIGKVHEGTLKVAVEFTLEHPIYHKQQKRIKNYLVDCDKTTTFTLGQKVFITPCKKISKRKSWKVLI
jgi:ribosomal protein S17